MNRIRVIFIIWSYSAGGGAESLLTLIVNSLDKEKYEISVIELVDYGIKKEPADSSINILPSITSVLADDRREKMFKIIHEPWKIFDEYIGDGYDIYVSFNYQRPSFLLQPRKKNIAWIHGDVFDLTDRTMIEERFLQDAVFYRCNRIVPISDRTELSLKVLFPNHIDKIQKIYNGIDIDKIKELSEAPSDISVESRSICFVGRLDENKDPLRALTIFDSLHKNMPECHMYYLGDGKLREDLEHRVDEYGISDYVHVLGYVENPYPIIKQCSAILHTSKSEGFQVSLLEGLALGVPFVSTDVGASRMMSAEGTCGVIYESDTEAENGLVKVINADLSQNCENSVERFSKENYISQIERLIDEVYHQG